LVAGALRLSQLKIKIWFQNHRYKLKKLHPPPTLSGHRGPSAIGVGHRQAIVGVDDFTSHQQQQQLCWTNSRQQQQRLVNEAAKQL